jgi:hypothetical protein
MRATITNDVLFLHPEDVPPYKKNGPIVRNSYFWALKSIAARAHRDKPWEYESEIWPALARMLESFAASGYLNLTETQLEFAENATIPPVLRSVSTWE